MLGRQERWQEDLFLAGPLRDLVPDDHILKRVDRVLDLAWLRDEVRDCCHDRRGRRSIAPEAAVRLVPAGLFAGITSDRKLLREAQVNLAPLVCVLSAARAVAGPQQSDAEAWRLHMVGTGRAPNTIR